MADSDSSIDLDGLNDDSNDDDTSSSRELDVYKSIIDFCGGPDLIEVFGPSGSGKSELAVQAMKDAMANSGKSTLLIDTERNVGSIDEIGASDYVYVPDWHDIYNYVIGKNNAMSDDDFGENTTGSNILDGGYDVVVLDSIGFPALVQYGKYRVEDNADQFKVFNELQVITGELKKYAQKNEALVIVINQPKSDLSGDDDPGPFGDKSIYGFKEVWKTDKESTNEIKTTCTVNAYRSREAGKGRTLYRLEIDDSGTTVTEVSEDDVDTWT